MFSDQLKFDHVKVVRRLMDASADVYDDVVVDDVVVIDDDDDDVDDDHNYGIILSQIPIESAGAN